jgi:histidinol-phosphate aminotransferase
MSRYWSAVVHGLTPYVPGEQPKLANLVKLNTNENPYGPSPRVLDAVRAEAADTLRLYPDPNSDRLRAGIAAYHGVTADQVFVGNGSDEVLGHAFMALLKHERPILFPDITYSFYPVYCGLYEIAHRTIPLTESFEIRVDDYLTPNGGVIFPNPNAPTGRLLALAEIERLLAGNPDSVVVIDEAYIDFGGESAVGLVARYPQLLVVRTLSKSHALAGLRVGYAIGQPHLIEALGRVKDSFNSYPLDRFAQAGALASIEDRAHFESLCAKVVATRTRLVAEMEATRLRGAALRCQFRLRPPSGARRRRTGRRLRERSIIVRHFRNPARIAPFLRITVGTDAQCDALLAALKAIENQPARIPLQPYFPTPCAPPKSPATPSRPRSRSASISTARAFPSSPPGCRFSTTCSTRSRATA